MSLLRNMSLIKRSFTPGSRVKGSWVEGKPIDTPFKGTAQPASGKVLELLPEGKRTTETILVFAPKELEFTAADSEAQRSGDIIIWEDRLYEVQVVKPWKVGMLPHWELVASRVKEGDK
jgi:hypothetical protein